MKWQLFQSDSGSKRGVALIIVLGFLSIMMIMAVTFLTQSRMERLVAGVSLDAQRGRQMARTALNAAMSDLSNALYPAGGAKYMLPPKGSEYELFTSMKPYVSGEIQPTLSGNNGTLTADGIELMKGEARNWIPRDYLADEVYAMDNAHWILVRQDPDKGAATNNPVVGRYAYLCFDMSGGIDANLIALQDGIFLTGNTTNRSSVRNVGMGELKEMQPIKDLANKPPSDPKGKFKQLRKGWHGFDSLSELILLTNGRYNGGENSIKAGGVTYNGAEYAPIDEGVSAEELPPSKVWSAKKTPRWREDPNGEWTRIEKGWPALNPTNVSDLVPYSLATFRGWEYDPNTAKWKTNNLVAWDEHESWDAAKWETALGDLKNQFEGGTFPAWWEKALRDYTEETDAPEGLDYPSPKNVPMINEVSMQMTAQAPASGASTFQLLVTMQIEVWFPFPADDNARPDNYRIDLTIGGGSAAAAPLGVGLRIPMIMEDTNVPPNRVQVTEWNALPLTVAPALPFSAVPGAPQFLTLSYTIPVTVAGPIDSTWKLRIAQTQGEGIQIETGGQVVDQVPAIPFNYMGSSVGMFLPWAPSETIYWEVTDPRLNHMEVNAWQPAVGSMGDVNELAKLMGYNDNGDSTNFYCRNAPMISPVEAGYISTGIPWKTLEFCSKDGADALSRMVSRKMIDDLYANGVAYTNGTISPNTSSTNVLRAAFAGLKIKDDNTALEEADLAELVTIFSGITATKKITDNSGATAFSGACMRGIDWIWADPFQAGGLYGKKWSKNERHRLIGMTWGLFNPNNSMFTILAIGQSIKEGPEKMGVWSDDDVITSERRAVAMVWRDPTPPGLNKPHEMFMRVFKFLDE